MKLFGKFEDEVQYTLQGINISHLGKRKIIFKMPFWGDMLVPWRVLLQMGEKVLFVDAPQQKDTPESEQETVICW